MIITNIIHRISPDISNNGCLINEGVLLFAYFYHLMVQTNQREAHICDSIQLASTEQRKLIRNVVELSFTYWDHIWHMNR